MTLVWQGNMNTYEYCDHTIRDWVSKQIATCFIRDAKEENIRNTLDYAAEAMG